MSTHSDFCYKCAEKQEEITRLQQLVADKQSHIRRLENAAIERTAGHNIRKRREENGTPQKD